jgi:hypothetical protein
VAQSFFLATTAAIISAAFGRRDNARDNDGGAFN